MAYSQDIRGRVTEAVASGMACRAAAERFAVGVSTAIRWAQQERAPPTRRAGRPAGRGRLSDEIAFLIAAVEAGARPPVEAMIAFIDDHRGSYGVEPICRVLPIAPSTYHAHAAQRADPTLGSARSQRDAMLRAEVRRVHAENFGVYGVRKVWRQLGREGTPVARCTVARLMRGIGLRGVVRGKETRTTVPDKGAPCPADRVNRQFLAPGRTRSGCRTSPTSRPGRASSTSPLSSTRSRGGSSAGAPSDRPCRFRPRCS